MMQPDSANNVAQLIAFVIIHLFIDSLGCWANHDHVTFIDIHCQLGVVCTLLFFSAAGGEEIPACKTEAGGQPPS